MPEKENNSLAKPIIFNEITVFLSLILGVSFINW